MAPWQRATRVRLGDRVFLLTTDGNRYSAEPHTVVCILPNPANRQRAKVFFEGLLAPRSGRLNADGSVSLTQVRHASEDEQ